MVAGRRSGITIATFPPRQCGIATYAAGVTRSLELAAPDGRWAVAAMDDGAEPYHYPAKVRWSIGQDRLEDYLACVRQAMAQDYRVVMVQHEYGIFRGEPDGSYILDALRAATVPRVTTLHTVLPEPRDTQKQVLEELVALSERVVVLSELGRRYLLELYGAPPERVVHIPHGVPDVPFTDTREAKAALGLEGRQVLLTTGFLSPNKGLELVIEAMPQVIARHPRALYVIQGVTHPNLRRHDGEAYRSRLEALVARLGLGDHVRFMNAFVPLSSLNQIFDAADVYMVPHPDREQIVSGTVAHAIGAGKAIVSTPFEFAQEALAEGRGILVPFRDVGALAEAAIALLDDPALRERMRVATYAYSRPMIWPVVAARYLAECVAVGAW